MTLLSDADGTAAGIFDTGMPRKDESSPVHFGELTPDERQTRDRYEDMFDQDAKTFMEKGVALIDIRERRLYQETHDTLENYCPDRLGITYRRAYQYMESARVVLNLNRGSDLIPRPPILPQSERHTRPLILLDPDQQCEAWRRVVETAPNGKITNVHVESIAREYREPDPAPESEDWTLKDAIKHLKSTMYDISQEWPQQYIGAMVGQLRSLADELTKYGKLRP